MIVGEPELGIGSFLRIKSLTQMRRHIKIPRILKINWVHDLSISVVFNNGEHRIIDFRKLLPSIGIDEQSPACILLSPEEFSRVRLSNNTLSWDGVEQYITTKDKKKQRVPFEIGADVLLKYSFPESVDRSLKVGKLVRESRKKSGLTQQELAMSSGTTRNYISRIENDRSDIELDTLRRIVEIGLGKQLEIQIK